MSEFYFDVIVQMDESNRHRHHLNISANNLFVDIQIKHCGYGKKEISSVDQLRFEPT